MASSGGSPPRKTLVLDLDETLVHADQQGTSRVDHVVEVVMDGHAQLYFIGKRPHTDHFLQQVSQWYELVLFTASLPEYADPVIDWLDPDGRYFQRRLFRDACTPSGFSFAKDLTVAQPDLARVVLVDNSPVSYALHKENGLPITGWYNDRQDEALLELLPILEALRFVEDVRSILRLRLCAIGGVRARRMGMVMTAAAPAATVTTTAAATSGGGSGRTNGSALSSSSSPSSRVTAVTVGADHQRSGASGSAISSISSSSSSSTAGSSMMAQSRRRPIVRTGAGHEHART